MRVDLPEIFRGKSQPESEGLATLAPLAPPASLSESQTLRPAPHLRSQDSVATDLQVNCVHSSLRSTELELGPLPGIDSMHFVSGAELTFLFHKSVGFTTQEKLPMKHESAKIVFKHGYPKWNLLQAVDVLKAEG